MNTNIFKRKTCSDLNSAASLASHSIGSGGVNEFGYAKEIKNVSYSTKRMIQRNTRARKACGIR